MDVALSGIAGPLDMAVAQLGNDANLYGAVQGAMKLISLA